MSENIKKERTYTEVMDETKLHVEETLTEQFKREKEQLKNELNHVMQKLNKVEEKNRCIRVKMFDWLSDTFHHWGDICHQKSVKIDSLCVIRMPKEQE